MLNINIDIVNCSINKNGIIRIADELSNKKLLSGLGIGDNHIGKEGALAIAYALQNKVNLKRLGIMIIRY